MKLGERELSIVQRQRVTVHDLKVEKVEYRPERKDRSATLDVHYGFYDESGNRLGGTYRRYDSHGEARIAEKGWLDEAVKAIRTSLMVEEFGEDAAYEKVDQDTIKRLEGSEFSLYEISSSVTGAHLGRYVAKDAHEAIDAMYVDAGYAGTKDAVSQGCQPDTLKVTELPDPKLDQEPEAEDA